MQNNAISWFEIPATDLDRATAFYGRVVGSPLVREHMGPNELAVFPYQRGIGIGGCVLAVDYLKPSDSGNLIYLHIADGIDAALARAEQAGGRIALGKTALPANIQPPIPMSR